MGKSVWMRSTGTICSCWICCGDSKYKRLSSEGVQNIIDEQLGDI